MQDISTISVYDSKAKTDLLRGGGAENLACPGEFIERVHGLLESDLSNLVLGS